MKRRFAFFFLFIIFFAYIAIGRFSHQLPFWETAVLVVRKHDLPHLVLSGLPGGVYGIYKYLPELATLLDKHIPLFPSFLKIWLWQPSLIYLFFSLPFILFAAFVFAFRFSLKIKLLFFAVLILYFVPVVGLVDQGVDRSVVSTGFDWFTPFSKKYVWLWSSADDQDASHARFVYIWNQKKPPSSAEIRLSCLGHYQLLVNNRSVYHGPVFAVYPRVYYDRINIHDYLGRGKNKIEVVCEFIKEPVHEYSHYQSPAMLVGGFVKDGLTGHNLADSRLWRSGKVGIRNIKKLSADAGYAQEVNLTGGKEELFVSKLLDWRKIEALPRPLPLLVFTPVNYQKKGDNVYDLGRFMPVYLSVKSDQPKACQARFIWLGDSPDPRGAVPYSEQKDVIIFPEGVSTWHQFSRRTGRYVVVRSDCSGELGLSFELVGMPATMPPPDFLLPADKQIYQISLNALKNGTQDHFEDSLVRERAMYLGDTLTASRCLLVDRKNALFVKEMINIFAQAQNRDGSFPAMAPSGKDMLIPDYAFQWPVLLEEYLRTSGDKEFAKKMYPKLVSLLDWAENNSSGEGFVYNRHKSDWWLFVDWTPVDKSLRFSTPLQFWYFRSLRSAGYIADVAGEDSGRFRLKADNLRRHLIKYAFDDSKGLFVDSFDTGRRSESKSLVTNSLAGMFSLFPEGYSFKAIEMFGGKLYTISPFSQSWVVEWLIKEGRTELALKVLRRYWGGMINKGYTSVRETYNPAGIQPEKGSHSHAWGCGPVYLYPEIYKALGVAVN